MSSIESIQPEVFAKLVSVIKSGSAEKGLACWSGLLEGRPQFAWDNEEGCIYGTYIPSHDGLVEIHFSWEGIPGLDDLGQFNPIIEYAQKSDVRNWMTAAKAVKNKIVELAEYYSE